MISTLRMLVAYAAIGVLSVFGHRMVEARIHAGVPHAFCACGGFVRIRRRLFAGESTLMWSTCPVGRVWKWARGYGP